MKNKFFALACCVLLSACRPEVPPIESCRIEYLSAGADATVKAELSPTQLQPLSAWFSDLGGDWDYKIVDHYPSGIVFVLKHKTRQVTRANLRGDELWIGNRFKRLTLAERTRLIAIIDSKNRLPVFGQ